EGQIDIPVKFRVVVHRQAIAYLQRLHLYRAIEGRGVDLEIAGDLGADHLDRAKELDARIYFDGLVDACIVEAHQATKISPVDQDAAADMGADQVDLAEIAPIIA